MSTVLAKYDAALHAIAEAKAVDELLTIRDTADALRAAARVANNKQAEIDMAEIRFRAERRVGEMMAVQPKAKGGQPYQSTGSKKDPVDRATLSEAGIDKHLADRARKLAAVPAAEFNAIVGDCRGRVEAEGERVTVNLLRAGEKHQEQADRQRDEARASLPQSIRDAQRLQASIEKVEAGTVDSLLAEVAELREANESLERENAGLKATLAELDGMRTQFEQGGFQKVVSDKDEEIRVLETRVAAESRDKVAWKNSADFWKEQANRLGYNDDVVIDMETGAVVNA